MKRITMAAIGLGLMICTTTAVAADAPAQKPAQKPAQQPAEKIDRRAWATRTGLVKLTPNGTVLSHDSVEDRLKIQELFARWGVAFDEGDMTIMASLFTEDARLDISDGVGQPYVSTTGRDKITASIGGTLTRQTDQRRHNVSNIIIHAMTETEATVSAYGTVTSCDGDTITFNASVFYSGVAVKGQDGVWRFRSLNAGMDKLSAGHRMAAK